MRSAHSTRPQNSASILLVDDNRDGVLARRSVLEELGYQVVAAPCGADALKRTEEQNFDLVITDYKMSPMDGVQLISELRSRNFCRPIILLSGFADTIGLSADTTGADVVIQKSANEIATLVRNTRRLLSPARKPPTPESGPKARARTAGR
jgi:two-component system, response regulator FlrC